MEEYRKMMMSHVLEKGWLDDDFFTSDIRVLERSIEESKVDLKNILFVGSKLFTEIDEVKREREARLSRLPIKYTAERTFEMKKIASLEREARMTQLKLVKDYALFRERRRKKEEELELTKSMFKSMAIEKGKRAL